MVIMEKGGQMLTSFHRVKLLSITLRSNIMDINDKELAVLTLALGILLPKFHGSILSQMH